MGDVNQVRFLHRLMPRCEGPVLEIGSKDYGSTSSFREFYSRSEYIGVDLAPGPGVDLVADLTSGTGGLPDGHFALAICCSVLEHVPKPWKMAENITRLLRPGGKLYVSAPWVWRYHPYPDDYFRFSHRGIASLFEEFEWAHLHYSTTADNEFFPIDVKNPVVDNTLAVFHEPAGQARRKYLPYLMVNMIGKRRAAMATAPSGTRAAA